jgi:hypothetical protein
MVCHLCGEFIEPHEQLGPTFMPFHRECGIREVLGGIGHLIDHPYWCVTMGDPDGGLSYRESARMALTWWELRSLTGPESEAENE